MDAMGINTSMTQASVNTSRDSMRATGNTDTNSIRERSVSQGQDQNRANESTQTNRDNTNSRELSNVVSMSRDGDTVQVNPTTQDAANRAKEGSVVSRERSAAARQIEAARKRQEEIRARQEELRMQQEKRASDNKRAVDQASARSDSTSQRQNRDTLNRIDDRNAQNRQDDRNAQDKANQINSFAGYTTSQIESLYRQGRISRQDYEKQLQIREARTQDNTDNNNNTTREMARLNGTMSRAQMNQAAITGAYSDTSNANAAATATQRVEAMQRVQDTARNQQTAAVNEGRRQWAYQLQA